MAISLNKECLLSTKAVCFNMSDNYGKLLLGESAFEFYSDRNPEKNIQIPWSDIDYVRAVVINKKHFSRYTIETKEGQSFQFDGQNTKQVLQTIAKFVDPSHIVHADTLARKLKNTFLSKHHHTA
jgi:hypothetical protein